MGLSVMRQKATVELLARLWVLAGAALTFGLGVLYAISPTRVQSAAGIELPTPAALTEIRSTYGGLHVGIGLFLAYCSTTPQGRSFGLLFCGVAFLLAGAARLVGVAEFGSELPQVVTSALELGFGGGAIWLRDRISAA
jgi:hypothetical protein